MKLIFGAVAVLVGCGSSSEYYVVGSTTVTSANDVGRDTAIDRETTERCNRELACGNIGPGQTWSDVAACRDAVRKDAQKQSGACASMDFYDLAVCMNAIRATQCARGNMQGPDECDGTKICR